MSDSSEPPSDMYRLVISLSPAEKALIETWAARWNMTLVEYVRFSVLFVAGLHPESGSMVRMGPPTDPDEEVVDPTEPLRPRWTAAAGVLAKALRLSLLRLR